MKITVNFLEKLYVFFKGVGFLSIILFAVLSWVGKNYTAPINQAEANKLLNRTLLVGITYVDDDDQVVDRKEYFGTIERINAKEGVVVLLAKTGKEFKLPPDLSAIEKAQPGEYRLQSTGEIINNPNYVSTWEFNTHEN